MLSNTKLSDNKRGQESWEINAILIWVQNYSDKDELMDSLSSRKWKSFLVIIVIRPERVILASQLSYFTWENTGPHFLLHHENLTWIIGIIAFINSMSPH